MNQLQKQVQQEAITNDICEKILAQADRYDLQLEIVWSAFKHKEEFPQASLLECLQVASDEWDITP